MYKKWKKNLYLWHCQKHSKQITISRNKGSRLFRAQINTSRNLKPKNLPDLCLCVLCINDVPNAVRLIIETVTSGGV
jgi:hypothetical protein